MKYYISPIKISILLICCLITASCKKYVELDETPGRLSLEAMYSSDASATTAVLSLYTYFPTSLNITYSSILPGLYSDELINTQSANADLADFEQSAVAPTSSSNETYIWFYGFKVIYEANVAINQLNKSTSLSIATKNQLLGEAKFFRALMFLSLVNTYGAIPLAVDPVALNNAYLARSSPDVIYAQILKDLKEAQASLPEDYAGTPALRSRVNKWAATALLARVYLYQKDYVNAEIEATKVINSPLYSMGPLANTFITTSTEAILQFSTVSGASMLGSNYRTPSSATNIAPPAFTMRPELANLFEADDARKTSWVDSTVFNGVKYYRINKYKLFTAREGNEATVVLRLAEQYLIRAEARAQLNKLTGTGSAAEDLLAVRSRAGLQNVTATSQVGLLTAVAKERRLELFGEFGHRLFDLKRTGAIDAVLGALKPETWKSTAALWPIPSNQISLNNSLTPNPGYN